MYHIVASKRHRQYGAFHGDYHPAERASLGVKADAQRLIELPVAVFRGIGGMEQEMELTAPGCLGYLVRSGEQSTGASLEAEAVKRRTAQAIIDPVREVAGNGKLTGLEGSSERTLELTFGDCRFESGAIDADPGAAPAGLGAQVGHDAAIRAQRKTNEIVPCAMFGRQDAFALRDVLLRTGRPRLPIQLQR
jgi:hypothetical protein